MCSRCVITVPHHHLQDKSGGRHSHNGEILDLLAPVAPTGARLLSAYREWQRHRPPKNIQQEIAQAYNRPSQATPETAEERALLRIMDSTDDVWIRHGQEHPGPVSPSAAFPDPQTRYTVGQAVLSDPSAGWYAVDLDSTPWGAFTEHSVELTSGLPWTYTVGLLPYSIFRELGGELQHPEDRDHLYARSSIAAGNWVFLYRDFDQYTVEPLTQAVTRAQLLRSGVPAIHYRTYSVLIQLYRRLREYSTVHPSRKT